MELSFREGDIGCFSPTLHVCPLHVNSLPIEYTLHRLFLSITNEPPSMVRQCFQNTQLLQLEIHSELRDCQQLTHGDRHKEHIINTAQSYLCITYRIFSSPFRSLERHASTILLFRSFLLAGIWKQARQGAHYIHVPLSPACHRLLFPSPVDRQLIRQQWAS